MSNAKSAILSRIRNALGRERMSQQAAGDLNQRLADPPRSITPDRVLLSKPELVEEFIRMTVKETTTVHRVNGSEDVPAAAADFLSSHGLPERMALSPDKAIEEMAWEKTGIHVRFGQAEKDDATSMTPAYAGIAETGALMMVSGPDHPYTLNLLPENHIAVLDVSRIVATPEDAYDMLRNEFGTGLIPRTILMVTGPSRSADIGFSLQFGAHGPRRLHCILIN